MTEAVKARPLIYFRKKEFYLSVDRYPENDATRIQLLNADGGVEFTATVMSPQTLPDAVFYIKDHSENAGMVQALGRAHLIEPTGQSYRVGSQEIKQFSATVKLADFAGFSLAVSEPLAVIDDPDPLPVEPAPEPESRVEELAPDLEVETTDMRLDRISESAVPEPASKATDPGGWQSPFVSGSDPDDDGPSAA